MEILKRLPGWVGKHPHLIAFGTGAMAATGFAPLNLWPLTLIGLAVLMTLVRAAPDWRAAAARGWCWGWGHFIVTCNWIAKAFTYQDNMPHWLGWAAVLGLASFLAVYVGLVAGAGHSLSSSRMYNGLRETLPFALVFAACWIVGEMLRATLLTGFAWNPVGVALEPSAVRALAPFIGTYGLSGLAVLLSALVLLARRSWHIVVLVLGAALLWLGGIPWPMTKSAVDGRYPHVTIIQPNIPEDIGNDPRQSANNLVKHMRLVGAPDPAHPRLILWPEGALTDYVEDEPWARERLAALLGPHDILAAGGPKLEFDAQHHLKGARNSIFLINAKAEIVGRYDKAHLVPGGEYLPLRPILSLIGLNRLVPGDLDFLPGPGPRTMTVPGFGKMGGIICYEVIFSGKVIDRAHRPDFLFNPSTDAWFGDWGPPQHLAQAKMRALEEGVPIIRATTTGISAVINASGRVIAAQPLNTAGALAAAIPPAAPPTFFSLYGNTMPLMLAALLGAIGIALARRWR